MLFVFVFLSFVARDGQKERREEHRDDHNTRPGSGQGP